jgi:hypothetical protein
VIRKASDRRHDLSLRRLHPHGMIQCLPNTPNHVTKPGFRAALLFTPA